LAARSCCSCWMVDDMVWTCCWLADRTLCRRDSSCLRDAAQHSTAQHGTAQHGTA
jgi:hypothetical protein